MHAMQRLCARYHSAHNSSLHWRILAAWQRKKTVVAIISAGHNDGNFIISARHTDRNPIISAPALITVLTLTLTVTLTPTLTS